jgi:hypothetical protein
MSEEGLGAMFRIELGGFRADPSHLVGLNATGDAVADG